MAGERFVVLGLAHVRATWFSEVARWSTAGSAPVEFVKCLTPDELRARLAGGRSFSALLIDGTLPAVDRDLIDAARTRHCPTLVVDAGEADWAAVGAAAVLDPGFDREELLGALDEHARPIGDATVVALEQPNDAVTGWRGGLIAVTGAGGAGSSTLAMALAQGLGRDGERVLLADLALDAHQALLHDAGDIVPGIQELVEAHRSGRPTTDQVRGFTFDVVNRRYHLLLGLRRHRDWAAVPPRSFDAVLDTLRRTHRHVVADVDPDVEGEDACGSMDVEDRNLLARRCCAEADAVLVVGRPGLTGTASLVRTVLDLLELGVAGGRVLIVVNRAPRSQRARAEITTVLADLLTGADGSATVVGPIFVSEQRGLDRLVHDRAPLPANLASTLANGARAIIERSAHPVAAREPQEVVPGSLGQWSDPEVASS